VLLVERAIKRKRAALAALDSDNGHNSKTERMTVLRMSISLKGEIEFETSRLPLTSDLESRLFGLSRVRGLHPDEVRTRRGERSFFSNRHVRFDERGWETERSRMAHATAPILDSTEATDPECSRGR
jgi:hypothetical protein